MSCRPPAPVSNEKETEQQHADHWIGYPPNPSPRRSLGDGGKLKRLGRVDMRRHLLEAFAKKLTQEDVVVVEATGNAASVASVIGRYVKKVVIANPKPVRVIAHAKIKTDTIDASVLAQL